MKTLRNVILCVALLLGVASAPPPQIEKGLAQLDWSHNGDRALLGVTQFYAWGMNSCGGVYTNCVPMNRNFDLSDQTFCPPRELLGNEPTNPEPAGHPIAASVAASVTVAIESACPGMRIVAANIHLNNGGAGSLNWIRDYLTAYALKTGHPFAQTLGVHCYSSGGQWCLDRIREALALYSGPVWVTEFGIYNADQLGTFLNGIGLMPKIERIYIWTNRDSGDPMHWYDLVNANGTLTALGTIWANWQPPTVSQVWLPTVTDRMAQGYP